MRSQSRTFWFALVAAFTALPWTTLHAGDGTLRLACVTNYEDLCMAVAKASSSQTGQEVRVDLLGPSELQQRLMGELAAGGSDHDVFMVHSSWFANLGSQLGSISSLSNAQELLRPFAPGSLSAATIDGKIVGMPWIFEPPVIYFREDVLASSGLSVPESFEALTKADETLKKGAPDPKQSGVAWSANLSWPEGKESFDAFASNNAAIMIAPSYLWSFRNQWTKPEAVKVAVLRQPTDPTEWPNPCRLCGCCRAQDRYNGWYIAVSPHAIGDNVGTFLRQTSESKGLLSEFARFAVVPANADVLHDDGLIRQNFSEDLQSVVATFGQQQTGIP